MRIHSTDLGPSKGTHTYIQGSRRVKSVMKQPMYINKLEPLFAQHPVKTFIFKVLDQICEKGFFCTK